MAYATFGFGERANNMISMSAWRISITNPKTGKHHGFMYFKSDIETAVERLIKKLEDETPIGDLPDDRSQWITEYEEDTLSYHQPTATRL